MAITASEKASILKLVAGMFDLAPDSAIFNDLAASYEAHNGDLFALAADLAQTGVFQSRTSGLDTTGKVDYLLANFGMERGTAAGDAAASYYADRLAAGETLDQLAVETVLYLDDDTKRKPAFDAVKAALDNKEKVAELFVDSGVKAHHLSDLDVISNVTDDDATVKAAETSIGDKVVAEKGQTYSITADKTAVTEGNSVDFTVSIGTAVSTDTTINYHINGTAVAGGTADPLTDIGVVNGTVVIPAGETAATITLTPVEDGKTEGYEGFNVSILNDKFQPVATSANVVIEDPVNAGQTFTLTTGVDGAPDFVGGAGDDTFNATDLTATALDALDGGDGNDVLNMNDTAGGTDIGGVITTTDIETINLRSVGSADITTTSGFTGLKTINVTQGTGTNVNAATTTDINVSGITGAIAVDGGKDVAVTDNTANQNITIGATTAPAGSITVTDAKQGTGNIAIDGGTDVTVNATSTLANATAAITAGTITIGTTTAPTGKVNITDTLTSDATNNLTGGAISVTGGTEVNVTVDATQTAKNSSATGHTLTNGAITVTADDNTTTVNVTQTYTETEIAASTTGNVTESASVKFGALKSGDKITIDINGNGAANAGEFTFTASKDLTAAQVAAAFANLANSDLQSNGGVVENGYYTGTLTGWTSASADGDTVVFTSTTADTNVTDFATVLTNTSGNSTAATVTVTQGAAGTTTAATANSGTFGAVRVDDNANASITTVTIDGYNGADIGKTGTDLDALATLSLSNSAGTAQVATASTTLDLTVNNVNNVVDLDQTSATVTDLTINTDTKDSTFALIATALKNLTVNAAVDLNLSSSINANIGNNTLKTVTVTGSGAVDFGTTLSDDKTLNTFNATANTGGVTATVETDSGTLTGTLSEYKFSAGNDDVTLNASTGSTVDVNVTTGAGDDTVALSTGITGFATGKTLDAGDGTADTLSMAAADLTTVTGSNTFQDSITGFERVTVGAFTSTDSSNGSGAVANTLDLANLDNISYVNVGAITADNTDNGGDTTADGDNATLAISNLAANGTVNLTGAITSATTTTDYAALSIALADATGSSDILNLKMTSSTDAGNITNTGKVTANDIETININVSDKFVDANDDGKDDGTATHTLILSTDSATTYNITGNSNLNLTYTDTALTTIDASDATGDLNATASNDSEIIKGGSGDDVLTATGSQDTLLGGTGDDTLTGGDLTTLTGGDGNDTFMMATPTNVNSYSTITDFSAGDVIDLDSTNAGTVVFKAAAITLASTAVFQDYANAAVNALGADGNDAAWFNYDGNTYIVQSGNTTANDDFQNGVDNIIKIAGVIDLGTEASYNLSNGTLEHI